MIDFNKVFTIMGKLLNGEGVITIKTCNDSFVKAFVPFYRLYRGRCNMNRCKWNYEPSSKYNACVDVKHMALNYTV